MGQFTLWERRMGVPSETRTSIKQRESTLAARKGFQNVAGLSWGRGRFVLGVSWRTAA